MKKADLYGIIGSVISCIILFLILWFVVLPTASPEVKDNEGIMVSFGNADIGGGNSQTPASQPEEVIPKVSTTPKVIKQNLLTSTDPNALSIAEQKKKEKKEQEAIQKQKLENERIANEKKRKEQEAIDKANAMGGLFGNSTTKGTGNGTGNNMQGNPAGSGSSGGNSWSLNGRSLNGRLVSPRYDNDVEGKVTVSIRVDENGNVVSASVGSPTTISDQETRNAAISAAKNTKFSGGSGTAVGTITYNFKLK